MDVDFEGYTIETFALTVDGWTVVEHSPNDYIRWDITIDVYGELIPEPATLLLLGLGAVMLRTRVRR